MKDGQCPRCHSHQVYSSSELSHKSGVSKSNTIPLSFFRTIPLDNYVCTNCGYVESYVAEPDMLSVIEDLWKKVEQDTTNPQ